MPAAPHWAAQAGRGRWAGPPPRPAGRELGPPALGRNYQSPPGAAGAAGVGTEYRAAPVWSDSRPAAAAVVVVAGAGAVVLPLAD